MDSIAPLLGLALRAGRLAVGEDPVGAASRILAPDSLNDAVLTGAL